MDRDPGKPLDSPSGSDPDLSGRRRPFTRLSVIGVLVLMLLGAGVWAVLSWYNQTSSSSQLPLSTPEDPRLTYAGPFRNIHPDVSYVGDDKCTSCHRDIALSFGRHPMGRSLLPISRLAAQQRYNCAGQ